MINIRRASRVCVLFLSLLIFSSSVNAQDDAYKDQVKPLNIETPKKKKGVSPFPDKAFFYDPSERYVYVEANLQNFSQLMWVMDRMDVNNNEHVDQFLKINECDIYRDFFANEFEWKKIREGGKKQIAANQKLFPRRFQFNIPVKLGRYMHDGGYFEVQKSDKIPNNRRYEAYATNAFDMVCNQSSARVFHYPRSIILELNRPFSLKKVPVEPKTASHFIDQAQKKLEKLPPVAMGNSDPYRFREAILKIQVKMIAPGKTQRQRQRESFLAIVEGYEVQSNFDDKAILHKRSYLRKKKKDMDKTTERVVQ